MNLFSVFVPESGIFGVQSNWAQLLIPLLVIPSLYWLASGQLSMGLKLVLLLAQKEFEALMGNTKYPGMSSLLSSLLVYLLVLNMSGLVPYVFTSTSHVAFTLSVALPLWVGHMIWGTMFSPKSMAEHLVPLGTPSSLIPLMVCIELISSVIRPLTLSVRLFANITAGHLLITLVASPAFSASLSLLPLILVSLATLFVLEIGVAMIQAYVFSMLSGLYISEVPISKYLWEGKMKEFLPL